MTLSTCVQTRLYDDSSVWSVSLAEEKAFHDEFYSFTHSSTSLFLSVHHLQAFCHLCSLKMKWKTLYVRAEFISGLTSYSVEVNIPIFPLLYFMDVTLKFCSL